MILRFKKRIPPTGVAIPRLAGVNCYNFSCMKCGKNRGRKKDEFKIQRVANLSKPIEQELAYSFLRFVNVIDIDRFIKELKLDKYSKRDEELLRYAFNYYKNSNNREKLLKKTILREKRRRVHNNSGYTKGYSNGNITIRKCTINSVN